MSDVFDVIVIGAGPAGMSAATQARRHGASVCLLDEQYAAGGQIYRNVAQTPDARASVLGSDYRAGAEFVKALQVSGVDHRTGATVWKVGKDGTVVFSVDRNATQISGRHIIVASGAIERPVPVPGWTKPGVMNVGAAQILMKTAGIVPKDAVLIGAGPLLYLVASQLVAAGAPPKCLVETQTKTDLALAMRHILPALKGWKQLAKGLQLIAMLRRAGVRRFKAATNIEILGNEAAESVCFRVGGRDHSIPSTRVLLHQGVVPNTQIMRSLNLDHSYNYAQHCFVPVVDMLGQSSNPLISIAGDGAGIGGATVAAHTGKLSALNALCKIGLISKPSCAELAKPLLKLRNRELSIRPFLDAAYPPPQSILRPANDTIICRCEEVRAGDIRRYAELGCKGPNQTKAFGRCGMGACQGRYCGLTVTEILSEETGQSQEAVGSYRIRAPLKPVTLKELASLNSPSQNTGKTT